MNPTDTPTELCVNWSKVLVNSFTFRAWIEPGHSALGAKLWVEVNATATGSVCNPATFDQRNTIGTQPAFVCPTNNTDCQGGGDGGGSGDGTGLDSADKGNLAAIAGNTSASGALGDRLQKLVDQSKATIANTAATFDCAQELACTGDPARCATLVYARKQYCDSKPISQTLYDATVALGDLMQGDTADQSRGMLRGQTINVAAGLEKPRWLPGGVCPAPQHVSLNFGFKVIEWEVGFQALCDIANIVRMFVVVGASILAVKIFLGGHS